MNIERLSNGSKHAILIMIFDVIIMICSFLAAFLIRFNFEWSAIPRLYLDSWASYMPIYVVIATSVFYTLRLYQISWRFISVNEAIRIGAAIVISSIINIILSIVIPYCRPMSVYFIACILNFILCTVLRFSYRLLICFRNAMIQKESTLQHANTMIIGAGAAGHLLIRELLNSSHVEAKMSCVIDDNPSIKGSLIEGIPIVGGRQDIQEAVKKYRITMIVFAIPSASATVKRDVLNICKRTDCKLRMVYGFYQMVNEEVQVTQLRDVDVKDLLGREPINIMPDEIMQYVKEQVIMVTGGGGSIGSELCRQLASHQPKQLIILDMYENNAYDIQLELKEKYPNLDLVILIASVRDSERMDAVFEKYHPDIVYHAAAHKHVPLMEDSPNEAVKNNVFGTLKTAQAAMKYRTKRFVLISTDKAVNPTNIMGATKRICEMLVQSLNEKSTTEFVVVRFGNVLGSNGSVIPVFKKQIVRGGPVQVTHPEIIRYFMTIPEAVMLILQAGSYAKGGEIFILDMGDPIKILDLAENLIRLSGYIPYEDIFITFTGLRPGEKLYEELLMAEEELTDTQNQSIYIGKPIQVDEKKLFSILNEMEIKMMDDHWNIRPMVKEIVPSYQYLEEISCEEDE